jgi:hypothetical protein
MKTIQELKEAHLIELAENAKEWKIKATPAFNNWFKLVIYRDLYLGSFPEYIRTCNRLQWGLAKVAAWARGQRPCKMWAIGSGIATGISFAAILMMTHAGVRLADQIWVIAFWAISAFILTLSTCKLF